MRRILTIMAMLLLSVGAVVGLSSPAWAGTHMCESFDPTHYCAGSLSLNYTASVNETIGGRNMQFTPDGGKYLGYDTGTLTLTGGTNTCMVADISSGVVEVNKCSGISGVTWALEPINGHDHFINRWFTDHNNFTEFFSGTGNGDAYIVGADGIGYYQAFDIS